MKIRFLQDYRGKLTGEQFYTEGEEVDLPNGQALVAAGRAEPVEPPSKPRGRPPKKK